MTRTEEAIKLALTACRQPDQIWAKVFERIGLEKAVRMQKEFEEGGRAGSLYIPFECDHDEQHARHIMMMIGALQNWRQSGYPTVIIPRFSDAIELANTDPPEWLLTSPHGENEFSALGVDVGEGFALVTDWRIGMCLWLHSDKPPMDREQDGRLVANVGFALSTRPEGLYIKEHWPSPKAMRKQGRKFYPSVQYIMQAARHVHPEEPTSERGPRPEGWTLSVQTTVRGHWRQQAHGPGFSLHKPIWIRPHRRGPDDAPVSVHPLKLGSSGKG